MPAVVPLSIYAVNDYTMGPYNYAVTTPEDEVMYFESKEKARAFVQFYKNYSEKYPDRVKGKVNGPNTRTKDE